LNCSPSQASSPRNFVSVIIPAYREEEYIEDTLVDVVGELRRAQFRFEVIVVLDSVPGDQTGFIVHQLCERFGEIRLIERSGKRGVGDAVRTGISLAKGSICVPIMADRSESPLDLVKLINAITQGYDVAIGDRFEHGRPPGYPITKYIANRCCNYLVKLLFHIPTSDTTNAFKAYRTELLAQSTLSSQGFEIFAEIPIKVLRNRNLKTVNIKVQHIVRKKREAKLSLLKDGPRYVKRILSLFFSKEILARRSEVLELL